MINVALISAHPTEAEARAALADPGNYAPDYARFAASDAPYLGVWRLPSGAVVHVFTEMTAEQLTESGLAREEGDRG